jgi:hypothetical protein
VTNRASLSMSTHAPGPLHSDSFVHAMDIFLAAGPEE